MKRIFFLSVMLMIICCTKETCTDYKIINSSNTNLILKFQTDDNLTEENIESKSSIWEGNFTCDFEGIIPLSFELNDSIYITNTSNDILKVYKENSEGKNIYNIDDYWSVIETSKNHFVYTYEITEEDLE